MRHLKRLNYIETEGRVIKPSSFLTAVLTFAILITPPHVFNGIRNNATSAIITPPDGSHDALIEKNFLAGGAYTLYCPGNSPVNVRILNNTFAHTPGPLGAAFGYLDGCDAATLSGNVTDQGDPVTP